MQEARHHGGETPVHIVDKGIQNARPALLWQDIEVGNRRRNERAIAFFEQDLVARTSHTDHTIPLDTHRNDKTVVLPQITVERF